MQIDDDYRTIGDSVVGISSAFFLAVTGLVVWLRLKEQAWFPVPDQDTDETAGVTSRQLRPEWLNAVKHYRALVQERLKQEPVSDTAALQHMDDVMQMLECDTAGDECQDEKSPNKTLGREGD